MKNYWIGTPAHFEQKRAIKLDDIGVWMAKKRSSAAVKFGTGLVKVMPYVFSALGVIGTVAMLWVGGHLLLNSGHEVGFVQPYDIVHHLTHLVEHFGKVVEWVVETFCAAVFGMIVGSIIFSVVHLFEKMRHKKA